MIRNLRKCLCGVLAAVLMLFCAVPVSASVFIDGTYDQVFNEAQLIRAVSRANYGTTINVRNTIRLNKPLFIEGGKNFTLTGGPIKWTAGAYTEYESMIILERGSALHLKSISVDASDEIGVAYIKAGANLYVESGAVLKKGYTPKVGGGVYNLGTLTMDGGTIYDCVSGRDGGGVYNLGTLLFEDGIIGDNEAKEGYGGGIYNDGTLAMAGGKTENNIAGEQGSGVYHSPQAKRFELGVTPVISDGFFLGKKQVITLSPSQMDHGGMVRLEGVEDPGEWREIATNAKEGDKSHISIHPDFDWEVELRSNKLVLAERERTTSPNRR